MAERRKHKRYHFPFPLQYCPAGNGKYVYTYCGNISMGGILLVAHESYDHKLPMELVILKSLAEASSRIELQGEVVWCQAREDESGQVTAWHVGIEFLPLTENQLLALKNFIDLYCKRPLEGDEMEAVTARDFFIRGLKKFQMGDMPGTIKDMDLVLEQDPQHEGACLYRAFARDKTGDTAGATEDFNQVDFLLESQTSEE